MATPSRLVSLDAFRGVTIALMVLVNAGSEASYNQLQHAPWHGLTLADTIFPSFLWIVGLALTLSLRKRLVITGRGALVRQILRRAAILYLLGIVVYAAPAFNLGTQRLLGVLQRIAICYLVGALLFVFTGMRVQIAVAFSLLAAYWVLMLLVPVPGYGPGNLSIEGNFAHYVDNLVLGRHNYASTKTWDPEGIVSTLPAISTLLFGVFAGYILQRLYNWRKQVALLLSVGCALSLAALVASVWMPVNKHLWTVSFSLLMAGLDFLVFSLFFYLVDRRGIRWPFAPFIIMGKNAIAVYMASELIAEVLSSFTDVQSAHWLPAAIASPANLALANAFAYTAFMFFIAWALHSKRWYLRV